MANLLQLNSAFGRPIETVNREAVVERAVPGARCAARVPALPRSCCTTRSPPAAEGYPFPTNLDRDQPIGGLVPDTQAELLWRAVSENWEPEQLRAELRAYAERHLTDPDRHPVGVTGSARSDHSAGGGGDSNDARLSSTSAGELMPTITAVTPSTVSG